jgi:hypothetical protein
MREFEWFRKQPEIQAVQWRGDNRDEVIRFFKGIGQDPNEGPWFSADEETGKPYDNYNIVKAGGCGSLEVSPDWWIVLEGQKLDMFHDADFREIFER